MLKRVLGLFGLKRPVDNTNNGVIDAPLNVQGSNPSSYHQFMRTFIVKMLTSNVGLFENGVLPHAKDASAGELLNLLNSKGMLHFSNDGRIILGAPSSDTTSRSHVAPALVTPVSVLQSSSGLIGSSPQTEQQPVTQSYMGPGSQPRQILSENQHKTCATSDMSISDPDSENKNTNISGKSVQQKL